MITTIKVHKQTKQELDSFRRDSESYDIIINKLLSKVRRDNLKEELIEAYAQKAESDKQLVSEWEQASNEV